MVTIKVTHKCWQEQMAVTGGHCHLAISKHFKTNTDTIYRARVVLREERQKRYLLEERLSDSIFSEIVVNIRVEKASVPVVGHVTAIVDRCYEELECVPRRVVILVQVETQQVLGHLFSHHSCN